jgi:hypothetical protein
MVRLAVSFVSLAAPRSHKIRATLELCRTLERTPPPAQTPHPRPSSITIAAPRSATITVGALMLPEVMLGKIEASITRRPSTESV